jgi:hypothetical protein
VSLDGSELEHVHSIVVKVRDGRTQFDMDGILENLSSISQMELAELLQTKYSPYTTTDFESKN